MMKRISDAVWCEETGRKLAPAVGKCSCGAKHDLNGRDFTCDRCGKEYNGSGQELAPREQWGEETGETCADICGPSGHED